MNPDLAGPGYEVLVFNSNQDIVDMLRLALGEEGYRVGAYQVTQLRKGEADVIDVLERDAPRVVIFDVAPPYQANWACYLLVSASGPGQCVSWLVTTTNVRALQAEAGDAAPENPIEIWGKPYDLELIVARVKELAGPPGDDQPCPLPLNQAGSRASRSSQARLRSARRGRYAEMTPNARSISASPSAMAVTSSPSWPASAHERTYSRPKRVTASRTSANASSFEAYESTMFAVSVSQIAYTMPALPFYSTVATAVPQISPSPA